MLPILKNWREGPDKSTPSLPSWCHYCWNGMEWNTMEWSGMEWGGMVPKDERAGKGTEGNALEEKALTWPEVT